MKKISCLMFDMGGVLTENQREDKIAEMALMLGGGCTSDSFLVAYWKHRFEYDRGLFDGAEYWRRIGAELGLGPPGKALDDLKRIDIESWFNMRKAMLEHLARLRSRVDRMVLLSNINDDCAAYVRSDNGRAWTSHFDILVLSCEHGLLKPEMEIYELALDAAGVLPGEALFIDDNADNVEGARRAGMSSFRFVDEADFASTLERDYELVRMV